MSTDRPLYRPGLRGYVHYLRHGVVPLRERLRPSARLRMANEEIAFWQWCAETPVVDHSRTGDLAIPTGPTALAAPQTGEAQETALERQHRVASQRLSQIPKAYR